MFQIVEITKKYQLLQDKSIHVGKLFIVLGGIFQNLPDTAGLKGLHNHVV